MGKHIVQRPLAAARGTVQTSSRQVCGKRRDDLRLLRERGQDLVDREPCVVHKETYCRASISVTGQLRAGPQAGSQPPRA